MEAWTPLMNIFMNSPCPETDASQWLQQSFNPSSSTSNISTASFLSLLTKPTDAIVVNSSSSSSSTPPFPQKKRFMWLQTLPDAVQARILSFLAYESARFSKLDLSKLARDILNETQELDFWVKRAARQLLDKVSDSNYDWVSCLNLDSEEDKSDETFGSVPDWLKNAASDTDLVLSWLPISADDLKMRMPFGTCEEDEDLMIEVEEGRDGNSEKVGIEGNMVPVHPKNDSMNHETEEKAACLKTQILNFESTLKTVGLADEIRQLCIGSGEASLAVLGLIEPWNADEETVSVLFSRLSNGVEELGWTSNILCSIVLPKLLTLNEPASRVLVMAIIEFCKIHQRATVYALLFPLVLRKEGINIHICDMITRIIRECLHTAHVSAFCQKLLCEEEEGGSKYICLPFHQHLISNELVWSEPLFNLFQNILNHNVHLTQDTIDQLVCQVQESAQRFAKSLKFGNFLLCLVCKCGPLLKGHKLSLIEAVNNTRTFLTKSILSKLASL